MIRHLGATPEPTRRIAVVQMPRTERNRLGGIRSAVPFVSMVTLSDQIPSTADAFAADVVTRQAQRRQITPGYLGFSFGQVPAPDPIVPSWNSWAGPCAPPSGPPTGEPDDNPVPVPDDSINPFWYIAAGLTAAASAVYLLQHARGRR